MLTCYSSTGTSRHLIRPRERLESGCGAKGPPAETEVWPYSTMRPPKAPFVGRDAQVSQVMGLLAAAERGRVQLAVIEGPAGIGKTRLAERVAARARRRGARVAFGRCWQDGEAPALWPWRSILRDLGAPEGLLDDEREPGGFGRFQAVVDHLRAVPGTAPFLIVLDDAHRADPPSLRLAGALLRERGLRLVMLLTCGDPMPDVGSDMAELLAELRREAVAVPLSPLSLEAVGAYIAAVAAPPPDPELVPAVTAVTKGNPLQLCSVVLDSDPGADGVHRGLERAIRGRFEQLSDTDRRLLAVSALLGLEVSVHEAARIAESSPVFTAESLARAVELGLARESAPDRFRFVHELVRRVATSALGIRERLDAHALAATLLTGHEPDRIARERK
jgi:predicted ATPase